MKRKFGLTKLFTVTALLALFLSVTGIAHANNFFAAYNGVQQGVTKRTLHLQQVSFIQTPHPVNGIAAGPNNDLYMVSKNHIYNYSISGALIRDMQFPDARINYTDIAVRGDRVYASYTGSQQGFTVRDLALNQLAFFPVNFTINGIAAGTNNDLYLASANRLYRYGINGTLLKVMTFPDAGIIYTDVAVAHGRLLASYSGSQRGVTVRDLVTLNQYLFIPLQFEIGGVVGGADNDCYVSTNNHLYNYSLTGVQKEGFTWPQKDLVYGDLTR